jgi:hypothetical protein
VLYISRRDPLPLPEGDLNDGADVV